MILKNPMFLEENKIKVSEKLKGRKLSESTRQKMRDRKTSDETKLKISKANIGREVSKETRDKIGGEEQARQILCCSLQ